MGTIGAIGRDTATGEPVVLTAMHVSGLDIYPPGSAEAFVSPSVEQRSSALLGSLLRGTTNGIDAAAIAVTADRAVVNAVPGIGAIQGWRPVTATGDVNAFVQMRGAATGRVVYGKLLDPCASLPSFNLSSALLVDIQATEGDSGAGLLDNDRFLLGLLVGEATDLQNAKVFCPITSVLARLACEIP